MSAKKEKKTKKDETPKEVEENPTPVKKEDLPLGDKVLYSLLGFGTGATINHFVGSMRHEVEDKVNGRVPSVPKGAQIGTLVTFLGLMLPESELRYFVTGGGVGVTVDDVMFHTFKNWAYPKIELAETSGAGKPEADLIKRYSYMLHIDETLPVPDKEAIILPEFPAAVHGQRGNPLQQAAIQQIIKECKIDPNNNPTLTDLYWIQQWILYWGIYEGNEGLWPGHDRVRTAAKLVRVRDGGEWQKDGHAAFKFDCIPAGEKVLCVDSKGKYVSIPIELVHPEGNLKVVCYDFDNKKFEKKKPEHLTYTGVNDIYEVTLYNGNKFRCTRNHRIFRKENDEFNVQKVSELKLKSGPKPQLAIAFARMSGRMKVGANYVKSIAKRVPSHTFDLTIPKFHNFVLADSGVIAHNCDCGATVTNQIMDYFGFTTKYALISQKPELVDGVHCLHHIFPIVKAKGRLWMVETIKQAPIVPLEFCYEIFNGLQRVVVVNDDGTYYDYTQWKMYKIKSLTAGMKRGKHVEEA